jgi:SNF2 family DNA or RNA helicase
MAKTNIIKPRCQFCNKLVTVVSFVKTKDKTYHKLECGHTYISDKELVSVEENIFADITSMDGLHPRKFQLEGAKFAVDSNARCLLNYQMGLGKTVMALMVMKALNLKRTLVICKAALKANWEHETYRWCTPEFGLVRVINDPKIEKPWLDVCPITIISYESLYRTSWYNDEAITSQFDLCILDECQQIKNHNTKRAIAVKLATKKIKHIIALSGTPIKNNASEYFSILNILKPERFNSFNTFVYSYVDTYGERYTKYGGISSSQIDKFQEDTKDFIIRRTDKDVDEEIPPVMLAPKYYELGDKVQEAYIALVEKFQDEYGEHGGDLSKGNILSYINQMRHLTGIAKTEPSVELIDDILDENPDAKVAIYTHQHDVSEVCKRYAEKLCERRGIAPPLTLLGVDNNDKYEVIEEFKKPENHILLGLNLADGEGHNIQFCQNFILVEREWNPANEEQVHKRFSRINSSHGVVYGNLPIAIGTIDEFFLELLAKKEVFIESAYGKEIRVEENGLLKELAEMLMTKGLDKWKM